MLGMDSRAIKEVKLAGRAFLDLSVPNSFDYILDIMNVVLCVL